MDRALLAVVAQVGEPLRQACRISLRDDETRHPVGDELRVAATVAADDRESQGHVLHDRVAEPLAVQSRIGHEDADVGIANDAQHLRPRLREDDDASFDQVVSRVPEAFAVGSVADKEESPLLPVPAQTPRGFDDHVVVLLRRHAGGHHHGEGRRVGCVALLIDSRVEMGRSRCRRRGPSPG